MRLVLCRLEDIPDPGSEGFEAAGREIFVVRRGGRLTAYENTCPHTGGPLDWVPGRFLTRENDLIVCATHGALFRIESGECLAGPCKGERLTKLAVRRDGPDVVLDG